MLSLIWIRPFHLCIWFVNVDGPSQNPCCKTLGSWCSILLFFYFVIHCLMHVEYYACVALHFFSALYAMSRNAAIIYEVDPFLSFSSFSSFSSSSSSVLSSSFPTPGQSELFSSTSSWLSFSSPSIHSRPVASSPASRFVPQYQSPLSLDSDDDVLISIEEARISHSSYFKTTSYLNPYWVYDRSDLSPFASPSLPLRVRYQEPSHRCRLGLSLPPHVTPWTQKPFTFHSPATTCPIPVPNYVRTDPSAATATATANLKRVFVPVQQFMVCRID